MNNLLLAISLTALALSSVSIFIHYKNSSKVKKDKLKKEKEDLISLLIDAKIKITEDFKDEPSYKRLFLHETNMMLNRVVEA